MAKIKTIKELKIFHDKKLYAVKLQLILNSMKCYRNKILAENSETQILINLSEYISIFEKKIQDVQNELMFEEPEIIETINAVNDDVAKKALILHYCDCINWDIIVSRIGKWKDASGVKAVAYRGLKSLNKKQKRSQAET